MANSTVEKFYLLSMILCLIFFFTAYYFFGDSLRSTVKYFSVNLLSPILSESNASTTSLNIYQTRDTKRGPGSGQGKFQTSYAIYRSVVELSFQHGNKVIKTYDANFLYNGFYPRAMIENSVKRFGAGPVNIKLEDIRLDTLRIPWFIQGKAFDSKSKVDSGFYRLIQTGAFLRASKITSIKYLPFAPHWNNLESVPPSIHLFLAEVNRFGAVVIAALLLGQLWSLGFKEYFSSSSITSWVAWFCIIAVFIIFAPVRPLPSVLKNETYSSTFTIDENSIKQIKLPTE